MHSRAPKSLPTKGSLAELARLAPSYKVYSPQPVLSPCVCLSERTTCPNRKIMILKSFK